MTIPCKVVFFFLAEVGSVVFGPWNRCVLWGKICLPEKSYFEGEIFVCIKGYKWAKYNLIASSRWYNKQLLHGGRKKERVYLRLWILLLIQT